MDDLSKPPRASGDQSANAGLSTLAALISELYAQSGAVRWGLATDSFETALARCVSKALPASADPSATAALLSTLHLEDLVLSCACAEGNEAAWEHFVATYRGYLRSAAAVILRTPSGSPQAVDLADSLFADLYGVAEDKPGHGSLFRYFHGRSSLKTWLRVVLAQRHVDRFRATRRFTDLDDGEASAAVERSAPASALPLDPHGQRYLRMFRRALTAALAVLDPRDAQRLRLYYREDKTLAEIGRVLGEHESSVSRNLERIRRSLRASVESILRAGFQVTNGTPAEPGLSAAQIAQCLEYAAEDPAISLDTLFPSSEATPGPSTSKRPRLRCKVEPGPRSKDGDADGG
jgi:RNA polymerase sigma-70 factor